MKVIKPTPIAGALLVASSVAEADHPQWSAATAYAVGQLVIRLATHRIYERLVAGTTAAAPEDDPDNWLDTGPTNRWAMFDDQVGTTTASPGPLSVTIAPGRVGALALIGLVGSSASVTVVDTATSTTVYSASTQLDAAIIQDWYQYVTAPIRQQTEWYLTDLPQGLTYQIAVTVAGAGLAACAALLVGDVFDLGRTIGQPRISFIDYSRRDTDEFGRILFVRRANAKRVEVDTIIPHGQLTAITALISDLLSTPAVWIPVDGLTFSAASIYGFCADAGVSVAYASESLVNLRIEGLT